jgi:hypothetical protein
MVNGLNKHIKEYTQKDFTELQELKEKLTHVSDSF